MRHSAWVADSSSAGDGDGNEEACSEEGDDDMRRSLAPFVHCGHEKLQRHLQMGTVGILHMGLAVFGAEGDKLTSKVMERKDCADRKFVGERDWKPTSRIGRQRRTLIFHGSSFS